MDKLPFVYGLGTRVRLRGLALVSSLSEPVSHNALLKFICRDEPSMPFVWLTPEERDKVMGVK